ncbi:predicted protein [Chaetoceros tenuissimus]|uniref:Uncharacterized protein n=1 Tax=Chaetoceros tenuissimus TaxID=426638 RepID=A0AAD3CLL7_9STRA|nr:predicted protein [Chaetoceros tenuissimus]
MGKKSKRRNQKKSAEESNDDESDGMSDIEIDEAFVEFMLWSLSEDKADLTPQKFAKMNPHMTMKLAAGNDLSITRIMSEREDFLTKIEARIQNIEFGEGIKQLTTGIKFHNRKI